MSSSSFVGSISSSAKSKSRPSSRSRRPDRSRNQARTRLSLEALEERSLLAGLGLVADQITDRVTVFEPDTFAVLGSVGVPDGPAIGDVVILGNGSKGFVTNFDSKVFPIDLTVPAAPVLGAAIPIANPGEDIAITPDQNFLVVSDGNAVLPLSVIRVSTLTQIGTFAIGADSNSVDVTSNGSVLVTSTSGTVRRLTIDGTGTIVNTGESMTSVGDPNNVYSSPNGNFGVVVTRSAGTIRSFTVTGMTPVDTRLIGGIGIAGAFSPAGDRFYVRTQSAVQAYDFNSATGALGAAPIFSIPIISSQDFFGIDQVAVSPDGSKLYVPQPGSVNVFSTVGGSLLSTIVSAGNIGTPTGIAVGAGNVTPINDAPSGADSTVTTDEDTIYTLTVADFGFSDPNDAPPNSFLAARIGTLPAAGTLLVGGMPVLAGQFVPLISIASGQMRFIPAANANGLPYASFEFQVQDDGGTANGGVDLDPIPNTLTIDVTPVNDAPFGADGTVTTAEDTIYTLSVADFGFSDPNDAPVNNFSAVRLTTLPTAGTLIVDGAPATAGQDVLVSSILSGQVQFTPAANAHGLPYASFEFQVQDDGGTANGGVDLDPIPNTLTINVTPVNDAPFGADGTVTTDEDTIYTLSVADFGFSDPIDSPANNFAAVRLTTLPAAGTLTVNGAPASAGQIVPVSSVLSGQVQFTPAANAHGLPYTSFAFQVQDDGGTANGGVDLDPIPNTLTINVTPDNNAPVAEDDSYSTSQGTPLTVPAPGVLENDSDVDGDSLSAALETGPSHGTVTLNPDGSFTYTPDSTFSGTDTFTYIVNDGNGGTDSAIVSIDVAAAAPGSVQTIPDSLFGGTALLITGTSSSDVIIVLPGPTSATLTVVFDLSLTVVAKPSGRIIILGGEGNDLVSVLCTSNRAWLYGDAGNDVLIAGSGSSLLIGGDGNDILFGGLGRDVMIGGNGADLLFSGSNDDILVAGLTTKDSRSEPGHESFWGSVLAEWNSASPFATRVQNLRTGPSALLPHVQDDLSPDAVDILAGGTGNDWLIFLASEDYVLGKAEAAN